MTIPVKKLHMHKVKRISQHHNFRTFLQKNQAENILLPVLIPIMGTRTIISFFCLWAFSCEGGLLLLYNLPKVEHSMKPVVHHLNGCEKDGHHSRVHACYHQARRKSLRGSEKTTTVTETKYENETMWSTSRNECQESFNSG